MNEENHKQNYRELKALCGGNESYFKNRLRDLMEIEHDVPNRAEKIEALNELIAEQKRKPKPPKWRVNEAE